MMLVVIGRLCREDTTDLFCLKWHENALLKYFFWLHNLWTEDVLALDVLG